MRPFLHDELSPSCSAQSIKNELARLNVQPARAEEIEAARALGAALIGPAIVTPEALRDVQEWSGSALFVTRDKDDGSLTGVAAVLLMSAQGLAALEAERFDGRDPDLAHVAEVGDEPSAVYVWGLAAIRKMAGARLTAGLLAMGDLATPHLPYFGRAASDTGLHLLIRTGFVPCPGSPSGLLRRAPALSRKAAA